MSGFLLKCPLFLIMFLSPFIIKISSREIFYTMNSIVKLSCTDKIKYSLLSKSAIVNETKILLNNLRNCYLKGSLIVFMLIFSPEQSTLEQTYRRDLFWYNVSLDRNFATVWFSCHLIILSLKWITVPFDIKKDHTFKSL